MKVHRTIRHRQHPQKQVKHSKLFSLAGACRYVWNEFIGKLRDDYKFYGSCNPHCRSKRNKQGPAGTAKLFPRLRRGTPWLQEHSSKIVRGVLPKIGQAYKRFYKGEGGLPKFKAAFVHEPSIPYSRTDMKQHLRHPPPKSPRRAAFPRIAAWLAAWMLAVGAEAAGAQMNEATDKAPPEHYRQDCIACHARMTGGDGEPLYRRKDRLVGNYAALVERVAYCRRGAGAAWSKAHEEEVVRYLNRRFYHFEEPGEEPGGETSG